MHLVRAGIGAGVLYPLFVASIDHLPSLDLAFGTIGGAWTVSVVVDFALNGISAFGLNFGACAGRGTVGGIVCGRYSTLHVFFGRLGAIISCVSCLGLVSIRLAAARTNVRWVRRGFQLRTSLCLRCQSSTFVQEPLRSFALCLLGSARPTNESCTRKAYAPYYLLHYLGGHVGTVGDIGVERLLQNTRGEILPWMATIYRYEIVSETSQTEIREVLVILCWYPKCLVVNSDALSVLINCLCTLLLFGRAFFAILEAHLVCAKFLFPL